MVGRAYCKYTKQCEIMKEDIILIGGGGHCLSCIDVIETENRFNIAGIIDINRETGQKVLNYEIIGTDENLPELVKKYKYFFITIGQIKSPDARIKIFQKLKEFNINLPVIISPYGYVSKYSFIGEGTIIMNRVFINAGVKIGNNCIINTGAIIEHNAIIEDNCHISTGAVINGVTIIKKNTFIGSNSTTKEYIEIGNNSVIGAGLTVTKNIPPNSFLKQKL